MLPWDRVRRGLRAASGSFAVLLTFCSASAGEAARPEAKPAPYARPFQLRAVSPENWVRSDTSVALYDAGGSTVVSLLSGGFAFGSKFCAYARLGVVSNSPTVFEGAFGFLNPELGVLYEHRPVPELRLGLSLGMAIPLGTGGELPPDLGNAANESGRLARSAFDDDLFAVNRLGVLPGIDLAYVRSGLTLQAEVTVGVLAQMRGTEPYDSNDIEVEFTTGFHAGYFFVPAFSASAELRYQRFITAPVAVRQDATGTLVNTATLGLGPRVHLELSRDVWLRPGASVSFAFDDPMAEKGYVIIGLDLPITF